MSDHPNIETLILRCPECGEPMLNQQIEGCTDHSLCLFCGFAYGECYLEENWGFWINDCVSLLGDWLYALNWDSIEQAKQQLCELKPFDFASPRYRHPRFVEHLSEEDEWEKMQYGRQIQVDINQVMISAQVQIAWQKTQPATDPIPF